MNKLPKAGVVLLAIMSISSVQAKISKEYVVHVQPTNKQGQFVELMASVGGWSCSSSISSNFTSVQLDSKGLEKRLSRKTNWDYNYSTLWQGQPSLRMSFEHNTNNHSPAIHINLTDRCSKTYYVTELVNEVDGEGNLQLVSKQVEKEKSIYKNLSCSLDESSLPQREGQYNEGICNSDSYSYSDFDLESMLLSNMKNKVINYAIKYNGAQESFIELNTPESVSDNAPERFVFNVSQGRIVRIRGQINLGRI